MKMLLRHVVILVSAEGGWMFVLGHSNRRPERVGKVSVSAAKKSKKDCGQGKLKESCKNVDTSSKTALQRGKKQAKTAIWRVS